MSVFPAEFDPRADVLGVLNLVNVNTVDGDFGFMIGTDGVFRDTTSKEWWGSSLISDEALEMSIGGNAPAGNLTLSYFQDPLAGDVLEEIKALGLGYIEGRSLTFWLQPILAMSDFQAPQVPPFLVATRYMTAITTAITGPLQRSMSLSFETENRGRNAARGRKYTTTDHAALVGSANPSCAIMPSDLYQEQPLFA